jgi:hypothetical protein
VLPSKAAALRLGKWLAFNNKAAPVLELPELLRAIEMHADPVGWPPEEFSGSRLLRFARRGELGVSFHLTTKRYPRGPGESNARKQSSPGLLEPELLRAVDASPDPKSLGANRGALRIRQSKTTISSRSFASVRRGQAKRPPIPSPVPFPIHPHMLRHAAAMRWRMRATIRDHCKPNLGHKNIQHTVRYTELAPDRFRNFWRS